MNQAERYRALLDERSAALAARGHAAKQVAERREFLVCALGAERFGLALASISTVLPERTCTRLPGAPAALRGIISDAGIIVTVIDLARVLGVGRDDDTPREPGHFLRLRAEGTPLALAVDRVVGLVGVEADAITVAPTAGVRDGLGLDAVSGYAPAGSDRDSAWAGFAIVDLVQLLRPFLP